MESLEFRVRRREVSQAQRGTRLQPQVKGESKHLTFSFILLFMNCNRIYFLSLCFSCPSSEPASTAGNSTDASGRGGRGEEEKREGQERPRREGKEEKGKCSFRPRTGMSHHSNSCELCFPCPSCRKPWSPSRWKIYSTLAFPRRLKTWTEAKRLF